MQIFGFLGYAFGYILWGIFYVLQNFGLAIIAFTLVVKLILLPFSVKQQKSMAGTAKMQKKQQELREKYANNKQKLQEEMNKLYEKEGVKPMGGCLTSIVPIIVLFGIFYAVAQPLTNTLHINSQSIQSAISYVNTIPGYVSSINQTYQEIGLLKVFPNILNTEAIQNIFNSSEISAIESFGNGFNFFGIDLLVIPNERGLFSPYTLFPVFSLLSNLGSQFIMQKVNNNQMAQQQGCMKIAMYGLPLFSAWITYNVPAAMAFYWIISALLSLVQSLVLAKICSPQKITANAEARHAALMFENEAKVQYSYVPAEAKESSAKSSNQNNRGRKR